MIFINVDLPSPFAPTNPICSPANRRNDTSSKITRSPKPWLIFFTVNKLMLYTYSFSIVSIKLIYVILTFYTYNYLRKVKTICSLEQLHLVIVTTECLVHFMFVLFFINVKTNYKCNDASLLTCCLNKNKKKHAVKAACSYFLFHFI